jgi:hypothetical protein
MRVSQEKMADDPQRLQPTKADKKVRWFKEGITLEAHISPGLMYLNIINRFNGFRRLYYCPVNEDVVLIGEISSPLDHLVLTLSLYRRQQIWPELCRFIDEDR